MDAGCEKDSYVSDVTRTWPVNGVLTTPQRDLYEIVYQAHQACLEAARPGTSLHDLHNISVTVMAEGLCALGIIQGSPHAAIQTVRLPCAGCCNSFEFLTPVPSTCSQGKYRQFYPHALGHWLGMDTHDCASISQRTHNCRRLGLQLGFAGVYVSSCCSGSPMEPGCVITIEPGLYIQPDAADVPEKYRGIGIRLEDDVLITTHTPSVLSKTIPVAPGEVEAFVRDIKPHL
eukprot:scaffold501_cov407-Prasinococcus_capsulatus_cf.AAC.14